MKINSRDFGSLQKSKKMKKSIGSVVLFLAFSFAALSGIQSPDKKLVNELKAAMKNTSITNGIFWIDNRVTLKTFEFNGKFVSACYFDQTELIGFTIPVGKTELPE